MKQNYTFLLRRNFRTLPSIGGGVVDQDFRGNVGVIVFNHADVEFEIKKKDRIAQLICERIVYPDIEVYQSLDHTERGESGFGSTGQ